MTYSEVRKILASADQNKDGKLDYIEVLNIIIFKRKCIFNE